MKFRGRKVKIGKRGGVYVRVKGVKRYLTKSEQRSLKRRKKTKRKGGGYLNPWGTPPGYSS